MIGVVPLYRLYDADHQLRELAEEALKQAGWKLDPLLRAYRPPTRPGTVAA